MQRKLAGILYADVAEYSRLTRSDEEGTHARLKSHLGQLTESINEHGGRICHFAGDAVLADFDSVVSALRCAVTAQRDLGARNVELPESERLQFRIGVNLGDIMVDGEELYGTGVNVAARLEALAEPGGICISGRVFDQVEGIVDVGYVHLGKQKVKNIDKPIRTYKVLLDPDAAGKVIDAGKPDTTKWHRTAALSVLLYIAGGTGLAIWEQRDTVSVDTVLGTPDSDTREASQSHWASKPLIAVLPFNNLSDNSADEHIADGLTEDLITAMARHPDLFVIARNSTFRYKGRPVQMQEIKRDLGARYVVEGSMRFGGETLRVNAQLIDVESGAHLWAQKYDKSRNDLFQVQDELVSSISALILSPVRDAENRRALRKPTEELGAYELYVRGRIEKHKLTPESLTTSIDLMNQALALDANFAEAHALLAFANGLLRVLTGSAPETYEQSLVRVRKALEIEPNRSLGYQAMSQILAFMGRYDEAAEAGYRGIQFNPNDTENHIVFSRAASTVGRYREAVESAELAIELNPFFPKWYPFIYGRALYADGQTDRAVEVLIEGMVRQPYLPTAVHGVAALAHLGRIEDAQNLTKELLVMSPKLSLAIAMRNWGFKETSLNDQFEADLRAGGLPES